MIRSTCNTTNNAAAVAVDEPVRSRITIPVTTALLRVAGVVIAGSTALLKNSPAADQVASVLRVLDLCAFPVEWCTHSRFGCGIIPAALVRIHIKFLRSRPGNTSVIGPLSTHHPALVRSLRMLKIENNNFDESAALGAFAALATYLQVLSFEMCGLASLRGLEGHCEHLAKVDLAGCNHLRSLEGLADHVNLEEVNASWTLISIVEPLRTCPALTKVNLSWCMQLSTLQGLEGHRWLEEVDASWSPIRSIEPLRHKCPALVAVDISGCRYLSQSPLDLPESVRVKS